MGLTFYDPRVGASRAFTPAAPPAVGVALAEGAGPRERAVSTALADALVFLGLKPVPGREIVVGGADPGPGAAWLQAAALTGAAPDGDALRGRACVPEDFRHFCASTHYRKPLMFSWEALLRARDERAELAAAARAHADVAQEPSARALAGYLHRFREALARDLDLPAAQACVWDGLRPGALSPGSRAALLRRTLPALGLTPGGAPSTP